MRNILNGGESCHSVAGIFLPVNSIRRFRTPVWSVNAPTAFVVLRNGTGGTVSFRPNLDTKRLMRVNRDHVFVRKIADPASMFL